MGHGGGQHRRPKLDHTERCQIHRRPASAPPLWRPVAGQLHLPRPLPSLLHRQLVRRRPLSPSTTPATEPPLTYPFLSTDIPLHSTDDILDSFPAQSWAFIRDTIVAVQQRLGGATKSDQALGTLRSRRIHCLMLLKALKLDDDLLLRNPSTTQHRRTWTCSILLFVLLTNRTIKHTVIQLSTAELYISAYASLCALAHDTDIRRTRQTDKDFAAHYNHLRAEQRRWEKDPRRKEPWETAHQRNLDSFVADLHPDSLERATADWFALGLYTGLRKSEWCQPNDSDWQPSSYQREDKFSQVPRAFMRDDFTFYSPRKATLSTLPLLALTDDAALPLIGQLGIRWRTQKNRHRNQQIRFTPNLTSPDLCCVRRALGILRRHLRLTCPSPTLLPLSLYRHSDGSTRNITTKNLESVMRATIARWANLDPSKDAHRKLLLDWASHSLRVGATNTLYAAKFTGHQIQILLRWDSLAFMDYFRNLAIISDQQNTAVSLGSPSGTASGADTTSADAPSTFEMVNLF